MWLQRPGGSSMSISRVQGAFAAAGAEELQRASLLAEVGERLAAKCLLKTAVLNLL